MTHLLVQEIERNFIKPTTPEVVPGAVVKVHQKIKEGDKERVQIFEGLVIAVNHGLGASKTFTVRKVVEGIGVEKIFPLHSPNIVKIDVIKVGKVRQSKLYYMRDISGKAARLKEKLGAKKKMLAGMIDDSVAEEEKAPETSTENNAAEVAEQAPEQNSNA
jgi:large subunit ribosomal protein L19